MQSNVGIERVIPFNQLRLSSLNVRKTKSDNVETLAASLRIGQWQNVVVIDSGDDTYEVVAGERRYLGFEFNVQNGHMMDDHGVRTLIVPRELATVASLTENTERVDMTAADEYDAFSKLYHDEKHSIDKIADAFGVTPLVVERRLAITKAHPELVELFRQGDITTEQIAALCATTDQDLQLRVWSNAQHWNRTPHSLRRAVTSSEIDLSNDNRVAYIGGAEALIAAGGVVRRDIFSQNGEGGLTKDDALLDRLATDKLVEAAAQLQTSEGWLWVEVATHENKYDFTRCGKVEPFQPPLPAELQEKLTALETENDKLEDEENAIYNSDSAEEMPEETARLEAISDRKSEIEDEIEGITDYAKSLATFAPEVKAYSGAVVYLDGEGNEAVRRGLVRAEDRKQAAKAEAEVKGGRETKSAGRKENAVSDALSRALYAQRNVAAQIVLADHAREAKILLVASILKTMAHESWDAPCHVRGWTSGELPTEGDHAKKLAGEFTAKVAGTLGKLKKEKDLWTVLSGKTDAELDALLAVGVANSLNLSHDHKGLTGKLLDAIGFDMADHFVTTVDTYFGRVNKVLTVTALKEMGQADDADKLMAMKGRDLALLAEKRADGVRWVPKEIRTPQAKPAAKVGKVVAKKPADKVRRTEAKGKAPAKKAKA